MSTKNGQMTSVPDGYKMTEVGVVPEEWGVVRLDDCNSDTAPICYGILMPGDHFEAGVPVVKVRDISDGKISEKSLLRTHPRIHAEYKRSTLAPDDVLITIRGTTGRLAMVPRSLDGANITQDTARIRCNSTAASHYIYYALQSSSAQSQVALRTIGQAVKGINIRDVRDLRISLPPLPEQRAIATALSDTDDLIASLERLIAKKRRIKQATMQELLSGERRLEGFEGGWEERRLGQLGSCLRGVSYRPEFDLSGWEADDTVRLLRSNNISEGKLVLEDVQFVSGSTVRDDQLLREDDIVICAANGSRALVGKSGRFSEQSRSYTFGAFMACFRTDLGIADPKFVSYVFLSSAFRSHVDVILSGSSINNLSPGQVSEAIVPVPPLPEQRAIATILTILDDELASLKSKLTKLRQLKEGMMGELLTGRVRLVSD